MLNLYKIHTTVDLRALVAIHMHRVFAKDQSRENIPAVFWVGDGGALFDLMDWLDTPSNEALTSNVYYVQAISNAHALDTASVRGVPLLDSSHAHRADVNFNYGINAKQHGMYTHLHTDTDADVFMTYTYKALDALLQRLQLAGVRAERTDTRTGARSVRIIDSHLFSALDVWYTAYNYDKERRAATPENPLPLLIQPHVHVESVIFPEIVCVGHTTEASQQTLPRTNIASQVELTRATGVVDAPRIQSASVRWVNMCARVCVHLKSGNVISTPTIRMGGIIHTCRVEDTFSPRTDPLGVAWQEPIARAMRKFLKCRGVHEISTHAYRESRDAIIAEPDDGLSGRGSWAPAAAYMRSWICEVDDAPSEVQRIHFAFRYKPSWSELCCVVPGIDFGVYTIPSVRSRGYGSVGPQYGSDFIGKGGMSC